MGTRADQYPEVGMAAGIRKKVPRDDSPMLARLSGVEAVQRTVRQFLLVNEALDLRVEI